MLKEKDKPMQDIPTGVLTAFIVILVLSAVIFAVYEYDKWDKNQRQIGEVLGRCFCAKRGLELDRYCRECDSNIRCITSDGQRSDYNVDVERVKC
jgi:hypothetical protein